MKKQILITVGVLIILLIIGIWGYLFLFGTPKDSADVFARFGMGTTVTTPSIPLESSTVDVANTNENNTPQRLKQLTTRPVAGAVFVTDVVRYVEQGTGHVYEINLATGTETLVSGTTIPETAEAHFSSKGDSVALTSYGNTGNKTIVGKITSGGNIDGITLPIGATDVAFGTATNTLFYRLDDSDGSSGYSYDTSTAQGAQLFSIPLRDVRVLWDNPLYVYTTPSATQRGYLYKIVENNLMYIAPGETGLTGFTYDAGIIITSGGESPSSLAYTNDGEILTLPLAFIPEKCTKSPTGTSTLYCTTPSDLSKGIFPDDWYKGVVSYSDILWSVRVTEGSATVLSNLLSESGREIDISKIGTNSTGTYIYFINKNDNTLWMFDTTL